MSNTPKSSKVFDPKREEVFQIESDVPDPAGSGKRGYQSTLKLDATKIEVSVRYQDIIMTCDLYMDAPMRVIIRCPRCRNDLSITADRKTIEFDPLYMIEHGGRLSISAFECTWELDPKGRRREFGLGLCGWKAAIEDNIAHDA